MASSDDRVGELFRHRYPAISIHYLVHAFEDIPPEAQHEAAAILSSPSGISLRQRAFDVLEDAVAETYGHLECDRLFSFLSQYPVVAYTYDVSPWLSRGERPDGDKIAFLFQQGFRATINLCAETPLGDASCIARAGLTGQMENYHFSVIDACPPTIDQTLGLLTHLDDLRRRQVRTYLHCEAGKGRTGVMVACIRMATMGWSVADALTEATNFGLWTPIQAAFITDFGVQLTANYDAVAAGQPLLYPALASYPVSRPDTATPTAEELTMNLALAAQASI